MMNHYVPSIYFTYFSVVTVNNGNLRYLCFLINHSKITKILKQCIWMLRKASHLNPQCVKFPGNGFLTVAPGNCFPIWLPLAMDGRWFFHDCICLSILNFCLAWVAKDAGFVAEGRRFKPHTMQKWSLVFKRISFYLEVQQCLPAPSRSSTE